MILERIAIVDGELAQLPVDQLHPAEDNPRSDLGDLDGLVASIHAVGIIEPLVVTPRGSADWTVVAGHRRLAAAKLTGLDTVPCIARGFANAAERIEVMAVENLQREDLSPLDEARAMQQLVDLGKTQREIAERIGCNQSHVSRRLKLVELDRDLQELVQAGKLPLRLAEDLTDAGDDLVLALVKKGAKEGELGSYDIEQARSAIRERKLKAEGKATGLPECNSWQGTAVELLAEATHWCKTWDSATRESVIALRNVEERPTPQDAKDASIARDEQRQREQAERDALKESLAAHHLAEIVAIVNSSRHPSGALRSETLALSWLAGELVEENTYEICLLPPVGDHGLSGPKLAVASIVDCAIAGLGSLVDGESDRSVAFLRSVGYQPHESELEAFGWETIEMRGPDADTSGLSSDELAPDHAAVIMADPHVRALTIHDDVVFESPDKLQRSPWPGYRAAKDDALLAKIGRIKDRELARHVVAYEWGGKNLRRDFVLTAALARLDELAVGE